MFNSDGTINVECYTLRKEGFQDVKIRKILGDWEILEYENPHTGDQRWSGLNFKEEQILEYIKKYGI